MSARKFFVFSAVLAIMLVGHTACTPEEIVPTDYSESDSIWVDDCDSTDYEDDFDFDSTDIDFGDDYPDDDSTGMGGGGEPEDSLG